MSATRVEFERCDSCAGVTQRGRSTGGGSASGLKANGGWGTWWAGKLLPRSGGADAAELSSRLSPEPSGRAAPSREDTDRQDAQGKRCSILLADHKTGDEGGGGWGGGMERGEEGQGGARYARTDLIEIDPSGPAWQLLERVQVLKVPVPKPEYRVRAGGPWVSREDSSHLRARCGGVESELTRLALPDVQTSRCRL